MRVISKMCRNEFKCAFKGQKKTKCASFEVVFIYLMNYVRPIKFVEQPNLIEVFENEKERVLELS